MQPGIDAIVFNENSYDATLNPATTAEFAHVVYRFGHSMLTEDIERRLPGRPDVQGVSLLDGFLNPRTYDNDGALTPEQAAGAVINGTTNQVGGQIDEHVIDTLRNNLLGLPLDLATINMVRARDAGVPPLQTARKVFFQESGDPMLEPYAHWVDFGLGMKNGDNFGRVSANPNASLVNFVAAYGKHDTITSVSTVAGKREAANLIVNGGPGEPADRIDFMNSTGAWANQGGDTITGLEEVDFWMGGLAEALEPFGGMLGSTFNYVFERQLEDLQFGDRFYYLFRNQGNQLFAALEANTFSSMIQRNTEASLLPASIFAVHDPFFDLQNLPDPLPAGLLQVNGQWRWDGDEHVEIHGHRTNADNIRGGQGDDALWGYGGNDRIEGGSGNDSIVGGPGDDILTDTFGDDNIKGGDGNDAIDGGSGIDLLLGGAGDDFVHKPLDNSDGATGFLGTGDDIFLGGTGRDTPIANEGDDWLEGGPHSDLLIGDNSQQFQDDEIGGDDVLIGGPGSDDMDAEGGDDVMVGGLGGTDRFHGMFGFDYVTFDGLTVGKDVDMASIFILPGETALRDRYPQVESVSGGSGNDVIRGLGRGALELIAFAESNLLTEEGLDLVVGLESLLRPTAAPEHDFAARFLALDQDGDTPEGNLLMGGPGSDLIEGRDGDDVIDGDAMLRVSLVHTPTGETFSSAAQFRDRIFSGELNPGDFDIVREIVYEANDGDVDRALFSDNAADVTVTEVAGAPGYWMVSSAEGEDILRNIEEIQFGDSCIVLATNEPCADGAAVTVTTGGGEIEANLGLTTEGVGTQSAPTDVRFTLQELDESGTWVAVSPAEDEPGSSLAETLTIPEGAGPDLRVVATYVDGEGQPASSTSEVVSGG